jgi:hypothetical protein
MAATSEDLVRISERRVQRLAATLGQLKLTHDFAAQMTPVTHVSDEAAYRAYLWASAICHATKGALTGVRDGHHYNGWDFLLRSFTHQAQTDEAVLSPSTIKSITSVGLLDILNSGSSDTRLALKDPERRAEILRDTASDLMETFNGEVVKLLALTDNHVGGASGAYAQLARLRAFRDPLRKKSSAFLMTVHFSGRWAISDQSEVLPMIDYHRMRILMRTGCIEIRDTGLSRMLATQEPVTREVESAIRRAAMQICSSVPSLAHMAMFDFDVLLWAHARSCCRNAPMCVSRSAENTSFQEYLAEPPSDRCVFEGWCPGANDVQFRSLWEPVVSTEDY